MDREVRGSADGIEKQGQASIETPSESPEGYEIDPASPSRE